jgi:ATP-dependent helicase/DNAse subunit B
MSRIVYLVGRSVDSRRRLLESKIASCAHQSFLHLVPTRGRVMELEVDPPFWLRVKMDTLTRIIYQIFEEHLKYDRFKNYRPIDDGLKFLLIKKILQRRGKQPDGLDHFTPLLSSANEAMDFPGIYRSVANFFSLLVRNNFQDRFIENLARRIISLEEKTPGAGEQRYALESDLTWLFGDFEEIKKEIKGYDDDDVISHVRSYLSEGGIPHILTQTDILILDGLIQISRVEEDILFHLFRQVEEVWWLLDYDSRAKNPLGGFKEAVGREALWHWKDRVNWNHEQLGRHEAYRVSTSLISLMERVEEADFDFTIERATEAPFFNPVAGGLYFHGQMDEASHEGLKIKSFVNRVDEVRAIASEIKRITHEEDLDASQDLGKIRVIFPNLNDYSSLIFEVFGSYGLPFSLTKGLPLFSHPLANICRQIFEIPLNHFTREDIFRLFSSPMINGDSQRNVAHEEWISKLKGEHLFNEEDLPEVAHFMRRESERRGSVELDVFLFDQVARKCGLNRLGVDVSRLWEKALFRVREYYGDRLKHARVTGEKEDLLSEYYRFLVQIALLGERLIPFKELADQKSPQGVLACFSRILDVLGFPENMVRIPEEAAGLEPAVLRAMLKRDMKAYALMQDLIQASAAEVRLARDLFRIKDGYPLLSQFYATFRLRLNNAYLLDERNPNVIRISQWLEIRGRAFDYIFAGGLTADEFPLKEEVNFILPEAPNRMFRMRELVDESKHLFSHLLRNTRKRLYLSFPRYSDEKEVQPSPVLTDLEAMVKTHLALDYENRDLEEIFRWEENPYLTSEEELLNTTRTRHETAGTVEGHFFPLDRIVLKYDSKAEDLLRAMGILCCRWAEDGLFEYDGLVGGSAKFQAFLKDRSEIFSPSQLETLANCPMRYLFEHLYGLKTLEELGEEVSRREMGQHFHAILRDFFERLEEERKNVREIGLDRAFSLAKEVADEYFRERPFLNKLEFFEFQKREFLSGLEEIQADTVAGSKEREGIFAQLLRFEEREFHDKLPAGMEYGFGQEGETPVVLGRTRIRGYIDRFDIMKENADRVHIYDYKTGGMPSSEMVKKGLSFQLPTYALALKTNLQCRAISAAFYALKREVFLKENPLKRRMTDHWEGMRGLDISGVRLIDEYADCLVELLEEGCFHHSTDEVLCPHCEFRYACYRDMRRMDHLVHSEVDHHIYSGEKNLEKWRGVDEFRRGWKVTAQSMQKALNLKTHAARTKHFQVVMKYRNWLQENSHSLPFHSEYIDELLGKIKDFEREYLSP